MPSSIFLPTFLPGVSAVKNPSANEGDMDSIPGSLSSPGGESMATHSSILAWRILWTEEPGGLQSIASQKVGHNLRDWEGMKRQMFLLFGIKLPPKIWLHFESYLKIKMNALYQILSNDDHVSKCCSLDGLLFWRDLFGVTHLGLTVRGEPTWVCVQHTVPFSSGNNHFIPPENPSLSAC